MKTLKIHILDLPSSRISSAHEPDGYNWDEYFQVPTDLEVLEEDEYLSRNMMTTHDTHDLTH